MGIWTQLLPLGPRGGVYPSPYPALEIPSRSYNFDFSCGRFLLKDFDAFQGGQKRPKIDQKLYQKIYQKSTKILPTNRSKIDQKSTQKSTGNRSWGRLGVVLGGSWRLLATKTENGQEESAFWGALGVVLEGSWDRLGARIAVLGRLGASWGRLGPSKNRCQNRPKKPMHLEIDFEGILVHFGRENGGKLAPKYKPKRT